MKPRLISILVASLGMASQIAFAADGGIQWTGAASLGLRYTNDNARDPSKLNEYRDLGTTVPLTLFDVKGRGDDYYLNGFGENLGRDDMFLDLNGGKYDVFKYRIYDNELRHNFGEGIGALSPFSGVGTSVLLAPTTAAGLTNNNPNTWGSFDHSYKRRDWGGMLEISANSPWYFRTDVNEVTRKGINVFAGALGTSPGNGFIDLPAPIDYTTRNYAGEAGYASKGGHIAMRVDYSTFSNANPELRWSNPFFNGLDQTRLPPDNSMIKWSANGNMRNLPGNSTLAGRMTYSSLTNNIGIPATQLTLVTGAAAGAGTLQPTGSSSPGYHGEIVKKSASLSLSSHPTDKLDTRFYWNWARDDNRSTQVVFTPAFTSALLGGASTNCSTSPAAPGTPCTPELFNLRKYNLGVDAGYRFNRENKVSAGLDWYDIERERGDFIGTVDKKIYGEWKNSSLDTLTGKIKYQYLERRSEWRTDIPGLAFNPTELYVRRFDFANVNQNLVKVVLDATPAPFLDLGLEAIYKKNDYKDTALGRTDDLRQEYYASVSYGDPKSFRMMVFGDIEFMDYNSMHRVGGTTIANSDPSAAPVTPAGAASSIYSWRAKNKDKSWQVGFGADWLPTEQWTVKSSLTYSETNGTVDFAAQPGTVIAAPGLLPIASLDNTKRTSFNLKGIYQYSKQWTITGGYAYERYRYSDIGYDGFAYASGVTTGTPASAYTLNNNGTSYMTGQYAFQPYTANIFYLLGTYKF